MESINCSVCQDDVQLPMAKPDCCTHLFCLQCLRGWLSQQNTCPLDRYTVKSIHVMNSPDGPVIETVSIPDPEGEESHESDWDPGRLFMPTTPNEWMWILHGLFEDLHNLLQQLAHFEGSLSSFFGIHDHILESFGHIDMGLHRFLNYFMSLEDGQFVQGLSAEHKQLYEQLIDNFHDHILHYFEECADKYDINLENVEGNTTLPMNDRLYILINTTKLYIWDFCDHMEPLWFQGTSDRQEPDRAD